MYRIQAKDSRVLPFPAGAILPVLLDVDSFHSWWPRNIAFSVLKKTPEGVGSEVEVRPFGGNAFCCRIESASENRLSMRYYKGIYAGTGVWTLETDSAGTRVAYEVDLEITSMTVRMLAKIVDVRALHSKLMAEVFEGLQRKLAGGAA